MVEEAEGGEPEPLFQPKVVEKLRDRGRVVDAGFREEILDELSETMKERRTPGNVAGTAVRKAFNEAAEAASNPAVKRTEKVLDRANKTVLNNL